MFSLIGYMFFKDDFLVSVDEEILGEYNMEFLIHGLYNFNKHVYFLPYIVFIATTANDVMGNCKKENDCNATETISRYAKKGYYTC
jgi:inositol 1,4,5-triphosphate receptor type 1